MNRVKSPEFLHLRRKWTSVDEHHCEVHEIVVQYCSSMRPEDLFSAIVSWNRVAAFLDFVSLEQAELILSSEQYRRRLHSMITDVRESWCDSEPYIAKLMNED